MSEWKHLIDLFKVLALLVASILVVIFTLVGLWVLAGGWPL